MSSNSASIPAPSVSIFRCRRWSPACAGVDPSRELPDSELTAAAHAEYTADPKLLGEAEFIIIAVPTPVDESHIPDFRPLIGASQTVGRHIGKKLVKGGCFIDVNAIFP